MDTNSLVQSQRITDGNVTECEGGKQSAPAFYSGVLMWLDQTEWSRNNRLDYVIRNNRLDYVMSYSLVALTYLITYVNVAKYTKK